MNKTIITRNLNINETSNFFGVSSATIRNWIKCGYLKKINNEINFNDIEKLQADIENGKIFKLNNRANKRNADKTFIPLEYLEESTTLECFENILNHIKANSINIIKALFFLAINLLNKNGLIKLNDELKISFKNKYIENELKEWKFDYKELINSKYLFLLNCPLPAQNDFLGLIYQSFSSEGNKSIRGSYYTPIKTVNSIVEDHLKENYKVLDPCCGTGQFLLAFGEKISNPENIYGFDIDEIAVKIARINLIVKFKDMDFSPKIFCLNFLLENKEQINNDLKNFDLIATNPPWGYHFSENELNSMRAKYPEIKSLESFSYFLLSSIKLLKSKGVLSFILPESILNVSTHKDIRNSLLAKGKILKVENLDRLFKNVFTKVVRLDFEKTIDSSYLVEIKNKKLNNKINVSRWINNNNNVFDINISIEDEKIIGKIFSRKYKTLKDNALWALGIVTGNNKKYLSDTKFDNFEGIILGKNVKPFVLGKPEKFIRFTPEIFQQTAPENLFRSPEKLIYKFISKKPVFALDNQKRLTLNSANILIPKMDYPVKIILALFNSSLYQFYYMKKFSSIKILRQHLEVLPLPLFSRNEIQVITDYVNKIINHENLFKELDNYIMNVFKINEKEKEYIYKFITTV